MFTVWCDSDDQDGMITRERATSQNFPTEKEAAKYSATVAATRHPVVVPASDEYTERAEDFLKKHNLKFRATYREFGPYFPDDKESRSIYLLTVSGNGRGRYSTKFGASINMTNEGTEPTAYDLFAGLTKSDPGTFEDFCSEFGYDEDSRSAEKTYKAVVRDWKKVQKFFTAEEIEELYEIN